MCHSKDTASPKSIIGTRKKTEQSQGGEGSIRTSTGTASWQVPAQRPDCVNWLWEMEEEAFWWGKRQMQWPQGANEHAFSPNTKILEIQGLSRQEEEVANGIERLGRIDPTV